MRKSHEQAFIDGYKPAVLSLKRNPFFEQFIQYPHISPFNSEPESYIFFQSDHLKKEYEQRLRKAEGIFQYHCIIGQTLGFPQRSVEFFAQAREILEKMGEYPEQEKLHEIGVIWAGFYFSSHVDFFDQEVRWLWDRYIHPKAQGDLLDIRVGNKFYTINFGDIDSLHQLELEARKQLGLVTV
ncbi:hypothetical protein [Thermoflavimicrobium daqui]|uniref:Uncharacterized protein n=1 Tax=Thermoflavimicrobium daqui TaxID=2137476 RepID=A0A364K0S1_9BACL|nr:hypothetical protein [Thermoflavimicrobium daqui]RAL20826.1 hypothetical protein DL897_17660 [Thermoflavimicrobium daqui]